MNKSGKDGEITLSERVISLVTSQLGVGDRVQLEAEIVNDLGADSLDVIELNMAVEEEFDIEINDLEAEKLHKVQDYVNFIECKLAK